MTIEEGYVPESYNGNGATTEFSFDFKINQASDLVVTHVDANGAESVLTEGTGTTNYSISVASYPGTGSITYPATLGTELPEGESLVLSRSVDLLQETDLVNQGAWNPEQVEAAFDYSRMVDQQLNEEITRSLRLPISSSGVSVQLPTPTADAVIGWNATADALTNLTPNTEAYLPASNYMKTVLEAETAAEARNDLGLGNLATLDAVPDDSITLAKMAGLADGEIIIGNVSNDPVSTTLNATLIPYDNSTSGRTATDVQAALDEVASGNVVNRAYNETGTPVSIVAAFPDDGSIPQRTEGTELLTVSVPAPASSSNKIRIIANMGFRTGATSTVAGALFRSDSDDALQVCSMSVAAAHQGTIPLFVEFDAGTTSGFTVSLRGSRSASTASSPSTTNYGGTMNTILVEEIKA